LTDPRFFPFYPGRKAKRSFSRERIEKELRGEKVAVAGGTGLARLSRLRRAYPFKGKLREEILKRIPENLQPLLEKASHICVQGRLEVLTEQEGTLIGHAPVVAATAEDGTPYCLLPLTVEEFYSLAEEKEKREEEVEVHSSLFKERLIEGLKESSGKWGGKTEERVRRALSYLQKGELLSALVKGLELRPHQAEEGIRTAARLLKGESVLLGWEMRGGKTLASLLALYLSGKGGVLFFKSSNLPDVLTQAKERLPFVLSSSAVARVSGLKLPVEIPEYDAFGRAVPNFQAFVARREKELGISPEYDMHRYFKKKLPEEVEAFLKPYAEELAKKGYDEELTLKALAWVLENGGRKMVEKLTGEVPPLKVYGGEERFLFSPASRLACLSLSTSTRGPFWLAAPPSFDAVLLDEADQFAGIESGYLAGLVEVSRKAGVRLFLTGTFTAGFPETAVALSCALAGKSLTFTREAVSEAEKELGIYSLSGSPKGKALSYALLKWRKGENAVSPKTPEERVLWREVEEAYAFGLEREKPAETVKKALKLLEAGYSPIETASSLGVGVRREAGTFNPIAFAHSVAPVYLSLRSRRELSKREEKLEFDRHNEELTLSLSGMPSGKELFSPFSYPLRKAVDTALERYKEHAEVLKKVYPKAVKELSRLEKKNPVFRRSTSTSRDSLRDYFQVWVFKGKTPPDEIAEVLLPYYERVSSALPSLPFERLVFKREGWPFKVGITFSPFFSKTHLAVDSFSNKLLYERVVKGATEGESFFLAGSFIAPNAFYLIDSMLHADGNALFVWRATGTPFDKLLKRTAESLGRELAVAKNAFELENLFREERGKGRQVIGASTDGAVARGVDLSSADSLIITLPSANLGTAVQLYSRLFSVNRFEAEVFLFGTYLREYKGKVYPSPTFYRARKTCEAVEFSKAVLEGRVPVRGERPEAEPAPQAHLSEVDEIFEGIEF